MTDPAVLIRRSAILAKWPKLSEAAFDLDMRPERLSRIIWGRIRPKPEEKRLIAWKLQRSIDSLFFN
jgi:hypothetical protein